MTACAFLKCFLLNDSYLTNFQVPKRENELFHQKTIYLIIHQQCNGCIYYSNYADSWYSV